MNTNIKLGDRWLRITKLVRTKLVGTKLVGTNTKPALRTSLVLILKNKI